MSAHSPSFSGFAEYYEMHPPTTQWTARKYHATSDRHAVEVEATISVERTITIILNRRFRIHILCTPRQLDAFVVGYLISEGLVQSYNEITKLECRMNDEIRVGTKSPIDGISYWREIRTSGCVGIRQQNEDLEIIEAHDLEITPDRIFQSQRTLQESGTMWKRSGGTHMAGLFRRSGELAHFSEDIGRHTTLDKVIGQMAMRGDDPSALYAVISGRVSSAMVTKLIRGRIPIVVSRAAPMQQALKIAQRCGLTVIGFSREPELNIYCCPERVIL
jgi:FdhD protein